MEARVGVGNRAAIQIDTLKMERLGGVSHAGVQEWIGGSGQPFGARFGGAGAIS
jgi:hypothetical protein